MVAFVLLSMVTGFLAGGVAMFSGFSFFTALLLYTLSGAAMIFLVFMRASICAQITARTNTVETH